VTFGASLLVFAVILYLVRHYFTNNKKTIKTISDEDEILDIERRENLIDRNNKIEELKEEKEKLKMEEDNKIEELKEEKEKLKMEEDNKKGNEEEKIKKSKDSRLTDYYSPTNNKIESKLQKEYILDQDLLIEELRKDMENNINKKIIKNENWEISDTESDKPDREEKFENREEDITNDMLFDATYTQEEKEKIKEEENIKTNYPSSEDVKNTIEKSNNLLASYKSDKKEKKEKKQKKNEEHTKKMKEIDMAHKEKMEEIESTHAKKMEEHKQWK